LEATEDLREGSRLVRVLSNAAADHGRPARRGGTFGVRE
jgi:hypothetical protein